MPRYRRTFLLTAAWLGLAVAVWGETPPAAAQAAVPATSLTAAEQAELAALQSSFWEHEVSLRASLGWRDNVLLSPFAPLSRPFARAEVEAFLWRPVGPTWDVIAFVNGDVLRFFSPPAETGGEQQWFARGEIRWLPLQNWRFALKADAFLQDTVIDLSETEATRVVAPTRAQGAFLTAAPRVQLPGHLAFEPQVQIRRTDYRDLPGDYDEAKAGARIEWKRTDALALSAAWFGRSRRYLERSQYTAGGRALAGTHLHFRQQEGEIKAATAWAGSGKWTVAATAGRMENRDTASGYFDYNEKRARLELGWERARWKATLDTQARRLDYLLQTVGTGISPAARISETIESTLRVERSLSEAWTIFAENHWERCRSNEREFSYRANTALAGIQRTF